MLIKISFSIVGSIISMFLLMAYDDKASLFIAIGFCLCVFIFYSRLFALLTLVTMLGFYWFSHQALHQSLPLSWDKTRVEVDVSLIDIPTRGYGRVASRYQFVLHKSLILDDFSLSANSLIRISDYQHLPIQPGEVWRLNMVLRSPRGFVNPAGFDYRRWMLEQGVVASGYIINHPDNRLIKHTNNVSLSRMRFNLASRLENNTSTVVAPLLSALLLGDSSQFTEQHRHVLQAFGLSHLFVVSGLHIGLMAALGWCIGLWLSRALWYPLISGYSHIMQASTAAIMACTYAALAGFSLPTQRALIMLCVLLFASFYRRHYSPKYALLIAAMLVLLWDPLAVLGVSFWLSFSAVLALLYVLQASHRILALLYAQLGIFCVMTFVACLFDLPVSLMGPLTNLIAIPLVSFIIVPFCFVAFALLLCGFPQAIQWCEFVLLIVWNALSGFADTFDSLYILSPPWYFILLAGFGFIVFMRWPRYWFIGLFLQVFLWLPKPYYSPELKITVLDVGQGLSILLTQGKYALLYDTGAKYPGGFSLAEAVIKPVLYQQGIKQLDLLIISHDDNDHAGGVTSIVESFKPLQIFVSPQSDLPKTQITKPCNAQAFYWQAATLEFIAPAQGDTVSSNNGSCMLLIKSHDVSMFLPGDIEKLTEFAIDYDRVNSVDLLIAPHHGSRSSSSDYFISKLKPEWLIVSAGFNNRFGHPHTKVIQKYQQFGAKVLNTAEEGAISFTINENGLQQPRFARDYRFGFWHR